MAEAERPLAHRTAKGWFMTRRLTMLAVLFGAAAAVAAAEDGYDHGRVLSVEPAVTLQRDTEPAAEEAFANLPLLPGDRVWTDSAGRAELQFADGTVLRLDSASKLDYAAHEDGAGDRVVLRLWSGGLYLHNRDGRGYPDFAIETPGGVVEARARGVYRVDAARGETRLSVFEGEAALLADREVRVQAGERAYARQGEPASDAEGFDRAALDDFDRWDGDHEDRQAYAGSRREYPPRGGGSLRGRARQLRGLVLPDRDRARVAALRRRWLAPVLRRPVGLDALRLDLGRRRALGLGPVPLRPLGVHANARLVLGSRQRLGARLGELGLGRRLPRLVPAGPR
jgi:hypothetical protein